MSVDDLAALAGGRIAIPAGEAVLRGALMVDAVVTVANGAAYVAAAGLLDSVLGVPAAAQRPIGMFLLAFAGVIGWVGTREALDRTASAAIAVANIGWVAASLVLLVAGWASPTLGGSIWIGLQAWVVALFAAVQTHGRLRAFR